MAKKKKSLTVADDLSDIFAEKPTRKGAAVGHSSNRTAVTIEHALDTITRQMVISGNRPRTIQDYTIYVEQFAQTVGLTYVDEITADSIYTWLASMNVSNQTKLTRLKCLKAFLSRCFDNTWITGGRFWSKINVKVDSTVKTGASEKDLELLLSVLDLGDFVQLRDATAALLMFKTGIRINTLTQLEAEHVDLVGNLLRLDGSILKNHEGILLPFDDRLNKLLTVLMKQNDAVRRDNDKQNELVFITMFGDPVSSSQSHNNIQKRLNKYAKEYGLKNINPHALRRGFAKSLLDKGANIAEISKALGHSNLAVTTKYLHLDKEEVAENLRKYL